MTRALATLLTRAIDYAGVFPPAKLDLATALQEYIRYRTGPESWILGKFALRATQLSEFSGLLKAQKPGIEIPVTVIGRSGSDQASWESALQADAADLSAFEQAAEGLAEIEAYEVRLPKNVDAGRWINDLRGFSGVEVFAELGWDDHQPDALAQAAEAEFVLVKARTGGENAATFPNSLQLAQFIQGAIHLGISFKLTAGLHHAGPLVEPSVGARMHGFVNVYAATAFAIAHDLNVREIASILDHDEVRDFTVSDDGISAFGWSADLPTLTEAREFFVGFGSCSIAEPLETLSAAGLKIT